MHLDSGTKTNPAIKPNPQTHMDVVHTTVQQHTDTTTYPGTTETSFFTNIGYGPPSPQGVDDREGDGVEVPEWAL